MKNTRQLLAETFASIPNKFAYREVRFYVHQAMLRLQKLETREATVEKQAQEQRVKEEKKKATASWLPPIYKENYDIKPTIDMIDKMIAEEQKKIEAIQNGKRDQGVTKRSEPKDDGDQAIYG